MGKLLTRKQADSIFAEFLQDQAPHRIAKKTGIHWQTVQKYIDIGDPDRGIAPLKERLAEITEKIDTGVAEQRAKDLQKISVIVTATYAKLRTKDEKTGEEEITATPSLTDLDRLLRLKCFLAGEPDSRVEHRMQGEVARVVSALTEAVAKIVKDQKVKNQIANELNSILNRKNGERAPDGASLAA